jgi:DNA polymerase-4/protein ImuB
VSPVVECERPGVAYVDLVGLEALYGEGLPAAILACAPATLLPRFGSAPGKFPAFVAASEAGPGETWSVEPEELRAFLSPRSIELLPLDHSTRRWMRLLGIATLGELTALPRHAVQAEFGAKGSLAWDLASGRDDRSVMAEPYVERVVEMMEFGPPLVSRDAILVALEPMLVRAIRQPLARNRFVRALLLSVTTEQGRVWRRSFTLKEPSGDRDRLWRILRTLVEYAELPGSVRELRLELARLTREAGRQTQLFREQARRKEDLEETLRQLKTRYGQCPVSRVVEVEPWSRVPERRMALIDFDP